MPQPQADQGSRGSQSSEPAKATKAQGRDKGAPNPQRDSKRPQQEVNEIERKMSQHSGQSLSFTINDEDKEPDVGFMSRTSQLSDNQRPSVFGRKSLLSDCTPTRDSVAFYARQSESQVSRQSQLAEELSQLEITERLVSSKFSAAVVSSMMPQSATKQGNSRRRPKQSLRYPNAGKLRLSQRNKLPTSSPKKPAAADTDESDGSDPSEGGD